MFVQGCEEGYDDNQYEHYNDIVVRDILERALDDPELNRLPGIEWLRREVAAADQRLRAILHEQPIRDPEHHPWWHAYVPRYSGREFAEDMRKAHGLTLRVVD